MTCIQHVSHVRKKKGCLILISVKTAKIPNTKKQSTDSTPSEGVGYT